MRPWAEAAFTALEAAGVRQAAYVPDAGLDALIARCRAAETVTAVALTSEEEGIALAAGAWLGGARAVVMMQSSGVGNCVNMLSLVRVCRFPLLMLVTMRGQWAEANPWQLPMGRIAADVLELAGVAVVPLRTAAEAEETVAAAATMAFEGSAAVAVVVDQRLLGAKRFARAS